MGFLIEFLKAVEARGGLEDEARTVASVKAMVQVCAGHRNKVARKRTMRTLFGSTSKVMEPRTYREEYACALANAVGVQPKIILRTLFSAIGTVLAYKYKRSATEVVTKMFRDAHPTAAQREEKLVLSQVGVFGSYPAKLQNYKATRPCKAGLLPVLGVKQAKG
jgi:hypothetical protein